MDTTLLLDQLKRFNVITSSNMINKQAAKLLNGRYSKLLRNIIDQTEFLGERATLRLRLNVLMYGVTSLGYCKICGKETGFNYKGHKFFEYCVNRAGTSCAMKDANLLEQLDNTCIEKYGVVFQDLAKLDYIINQRKLTKQKNYESSQFSPTGTPTTSLP